MYKAALEAIDQGETARAKDLFTRLLRSDSSKVEYWLWMSTLVDSNQERIYCLESALRMDPDNEPAKRGLVILGAREADKDVKPGPITRRNWEKELEEVVEAPKSGLARLWSNRMARVGIGIIAGFIILGLIIGAAYSLGRNKPEEVVVIKVSPYPSKTPTATLSPTPTRTYAVPTPSPAIAGATPLFMFLPATYTPTPLYVNTPHPAVEAYRAAIRAFEQGDWANTVSLLQQAVSVEPNSPDFYYYMGEAQRLLGNYQEAVTSYNRALEANPEFAPAYLGRGLVYEKINPQADIEGELNYAIQYDPSYVDAYLNRARVRIAHNNPSGAMDDLLAVDRLFPNNPIMYILLAQTYLELNDPATALQDAQVGYNLDITSLPAYLTLAKVYLAMNNSKSTLQYINTYLSYVGNDANGWAIKAQADFQLGNFADALSDCQQGLAADQNNAQSWYYCGLLHLQQDDPRTAVNELVNAVTLDPKSYPYNLALGKALWADGRFDQAAQQFDGAELLATTDRQRAEVYYNRAQVYDAAEDFTKSLADWQLLLALPADQVPSYWRQVAQQRVDILASPTPTELPTVGPSPTETPTPEITLTATPTPPPTP